MYLTYSEYCTLGGTISVETTFNKYNSIACSLIDYYTFNRLADDEEIPDKVKILNFLLIDIVKSRDDAMKLGMSQDGSSSASVTSQQNDGVSISYSGMSASDLFTACAEESESLIKRYLSSVTNEAGRKVLYRGLYPGE